MIGRMDGKHRHQRHINTDQLTLELQRQLTLDLSEFGYIPGVASILSLDPGDRQK